MNKLQASDALSDLVIRVAADTPCSEAQSDIRAVHAAVFEKDVFCGLVKMADAGQATSGRVFSELINSLDGRLHPPSESLEQCARLVADSSVGALPIADAQGQFLGVITQQSLIDALLKSNQRLQGLSTRALDQLESRTAERTAELTLANRQLRDEIRERKQVEKALRESEAKFRSLVESASAVPWRVDLASERFTYVGEQVEQLLGYSPESWLNIGTWANRIHPDDREQATAFCNAATARGANHDFEYRALAADGRTVWIRDVVSVVMGDQGPESLVGFMIDITERKRAEEALQESRRMMSTLIGNLQGMVYRCKNDSNWTMDFTSDGCKELTGYSAAQFLQQKIQFADLIHPDDRQSVWDDVQAAVAKKQPFQLTYRIRAVSGREKWVWEQGAGVFDEQGELLVLEGFITDITARKRAEEESRQHQAELVHVSRVSMMGEMATGIAHQLNQPLTAIMNYAESCLYRIRSPKKAADGLEDELQAIAAETGRAAEIIRGFRRFIHKGKPQKTVCAIDSIIRDAVKLSAYETLTASVTVHLEMGDDLPAILADPIQIQQVVLNLINNGIDAMESTDQAARKLTIKSSRSAEDCIVVSVSDTGTGFSKDRAKTMFDSFFTSKEKGLGMGLAISRTIVEAHGGRLWATSPGEGATFWFTLPHCSLPIKEEI